MAADEGQEKTEPATQKRRTQALEEGNVSKSADINAVIGLLMSGLLFSWLGNYMLGNLHNLFTVSLASFPKHDLSVIEMQYRFMIFTVQFFKIVFPFMGGIMVAGFLSNYVQVGNAASIKSIMPKFDRISPAKGFKRIFAMSAIVELLKSLLKIFIIGYIAYGILKNDMSIVMRLGDMEVGEILKSIGQLISKVGIKVSLTLLVVALADYGYKRWEFEKGLKMTKQEIKEESKELEGNPLIKFRIRSIQRQAAMKRMMIDVPKADVIITNPTHLAVALKYDNATMTAPKVVAKGARLVAERIKKIARENDVPIIENKPLARSLFKLCEVGKEIPMQLYRAVAELLAYIYKLKGKKVN